MSIGDMPGLFFKLRIQLIEYHCLKYLMTAECYRSVRLFNH